MDRRKLGLLLLLLLSQAVAFIFYMLVCKTIMHSPLIPAASQRNDVALRQQQPIKDDDHVDKSNGTDERVDVMINGHDVKSNNNNATDNKDDFNNNNNTKHGFKFNKNSTKNQDTRIHINVNNSNKQDAKNNGVTAMTRHNDVSNTSINKHDQGSNFQVCESDPSLPVICHTFSPGRLGNHLFEYASIVGLAQYTGRTCFFTKDELISRTLRYPPSHAHADVMKARCKKAKRLRERNGGQYDRRLVNLEAGQDYNIGDYLQSWIYFHHIRPDVMRTALAFNDAIVRNASRVIDFIRASRPKTTLVGVHVRRGDLATARLKREGYLTATPEFFARAMTYFRERFSGREGGVTFVVLGEDRKWSMENIRGVDGDVIFPKPTSNPAVDLQVLSSCQHMIRTVGTFGWWAAYKLEGPATVVYLKDFTKANSGISSWYSKDATDFLLPGWLAM